MATILITGGTGLIGTALSKLLTEKGHDVIILTRDPTTNDKPQTANISYAQWDIKNQTIDASAVQRADHIIHLAGANVAGKRWNAKRKKEIVESRTQSAALIVKALKENTNKVRSVISASGIGWYGPDTPESTKRGGFTETDPAAEDFLGQTCAQWEAAIEPVTALGKRLVKLRTGIVLDNAGGALKEFKKPLYAGVAAILGNGKQVISWIHIQDICRLYLYALENEQVKGAYNAAAHQTLTNRAFILELAKKMRGTFFLPVYVPSFALKIALGEMSIEVLKSATVNNEKVRHAGFKFLYPTLEAALNQLQSSD
ncbi:MAG: TIGR01777 family oxidoreductase [Chitinophagaceae bacterium]